MTQAYIFPGQGSQFPGMAKNRYEQSTQVRELFAQAKEVLSFDIGEVMFNGTAEDLKRTEVTQPAVFLHSIAAYHTLDNPQPAAVAGHSLGEFSALVAAKSLKFQDALQLVSQRALAMQQACEITASTMAAILGLEDSIIEEICAATPGVVVAANYNCPGQLVISGEVAAVESACEKLKEAGAKRALLLPVGGAFHSPMMAPAEEKLKTAIENTPFTDPFCPIYQNVTASAVRDADAIRQNLISQLTAPVKWTQTIEQMWQDGIHSFLEIGPGKTLQGLVKKIVKEAEVDGVA
ncbi:MAG: ACP S-malonyltransferase [Weeksellaceae bacterium]|nr:ACP S-malonyltransferase [Weeksellaceae bacterium]